MIPHNCPECGKKVQSTQPGVTHCGNCGETVLVNGNGFSSDLGTRSPKNRRRYHRYETAHRVLMRTIDDADQNSGMFTIGQLENLSGGGALVRGDNLPQMGETVEVVLATGEKSLMRMVADICHRHVDDKSVAAGLHFRDLTPPSRHCIVATAKRLSDHRRVS